MPCEIKPTCDVCGRSDRTQECIGGSVYYCQFDEDCQSSAAEIHAKWYDEQLEKEIIHAL